MLFADDLATEDIPIAAISNIVKKVKAEKSDITSEFEDNAVVEPGGYYLYEITVTNIIEDIKDIVVFDKLEFAVEDQRPLNGNVSLPEGAATAHWRGTFDSVITDALDKVLTDTDSYTVYYCLKEDGSEPTIPEFGISEQPLSKDEQRTKLQEAGWTTTLSEEDKPKVRGVAIDLDDYVLQSGESLTFRIRMKAPDNVDQADARAYNNPSFYRKLVEPRDTDEKDRETVVGDATTVRLAQPHMLEVVKLYAEDTPEERMDPKKEFHFLLYDTASGEYQPDKKRPFDNRGYTLYEFADGVWQEREKHATDASGSLYLKANQKAVFADIPDPGRVHVEEEEDPFWEPKVGEPVTDDTGKVTITVTNKPHAVLYVEKRASDGHGPSAEVLQKQTFTFQVKVDTDNDGNFEELTDEVEYWLVDHAYTDGRLPGRLSETLKTSNNGQFTLRAGQIAALPGIGEFGQKYQVTEMLPGDGGDWILKDENPRNGTLVPGDAKESFTNFYRWKDFMLTKAFMNQDPEDAKDTQFTFKLLKLTERATGANDEDWTPVTSTEGITCEIENPAEGSADIPQNKGQLDDEAKFTCYAARGVVIIHHLEAEKKYRIVEVNTNENYNVVNGGLYSFTAPLYSSSASGTITNNWRRRPLEVSKVLVYDMEDEAERTKAEQAVFTMKAECDPDGPEIKNPDNPGETLRGEKPSAPLANAPFTLMQGGKEVAPKSEDDPYGTQGPPDGVFKTDGDGKFKIKGGQTAIFKDAGVEGSEFKVTETQDENYPQLLPSETQPFSGNMTDKGGEAMFVNGTPGFLLIRKNWVGLDAGGNAFVEAGEACTYEGLTEDEYPVDKDPNPDLSVEITMQVWKKGADGQETGSTTWPERDTTVTLVDAQGTVTPGQTWTKGQPFRLHPGYTVIISKDQLGEGVTRYSVRERAGDRHRIQDWTDAEGALHHIVMEQLEPENDDAAGTPDENPLAEFTNSAQELTESSRIAKRFAWTDEANKPSFPQAGRKLMLVVERCTGGQWTPAAGIPYFTRDTQTPSDRVQTTDTDGRITLVSDGTPMPYVVFPHDRVYALDVQDPKGGELRIRELTSDPDSTPGVWGSLVGAGCFRDNGSYTTDFSELGRKPDQQIQEAIVNTPETVPVRVGKKLVEKVLSENPASEAAQGEVLIDDTETVFTFGLRQITEVDYKTYSASGITKDNYTQVIRKTVPGAGVHYKLYSADSNILADNEDHVTDSNGRFTLHAGEYAQLELPARTLWTVQEIIKRPYAMERVGDKTPDSGLLGGLGDNLMLIGDSVNDYHNMPAYRYQVYINIRGGSFGDGDTAPENWTSADYIPAGE